MRLPPSLTNELSPSVNNNITKLKLPQLPAASPSPMDVREQRLKLCVGNGEAEAKSQELGHKLGSPLSPDIPYEPQAIAGVIIRGDFNLHFIRLSASTSGTGTRTWTWTILDSYLAFVH